VLWVQDRAALRLTGRPYHPGLPPPLRRRVIHVAAATPEDALFALEEGLRCRELACVIGEIAGNPRALDFTASFVLGGANTKKADWKEIRMLLPFGLIGACLGAFALLKLPATPVLLTLGAFTMFFGFRNIFGVNSEKRISSAWALPAGVGGGAAGALFGTSGPPYIIYLTHRLKDKTAVRATFSWLFVIDGGFRLGLFLVAGLLFDSKLQLVYFLSLLPMLIGLHMGNKVHMDITSEGMLKVVGGLLVVSGALLFLKVIF
jgi:hypothetical protein